MRQQQFASPATTQHAAADQRPDQAGIIVPALVSEVLVLLIEVLFPAGFGPLPSDRRENQSARTAAPEQARGDQGLHQPMIVVATFLASQLVFVFLRA